MASRKSGLRQDGVVGGSCDRGVGVFDHPGEGAGWGEAMQVGGGPHPHYRTGS